MLLLAHLARAEVPRSLQADLRFVLQKAPLLLEEMVKIANLPRPPAGYGWLSPSVGALEMMQCITRALQLHVRKTLTYGGKARAPAGSAARFWLEQCCLLKEQPVQQHLSLPCLDGRRVSQEVVAASLQSRGAPRCL